MPNITWLKLDEINNSCQSVATRLVQRKSDSDNCLPWFPSQVQPRTGLAAAFQLLKFVQAGSIKWKVFPILLSSSDEEIFLIFFIHFFMPVKSVGAYANLSYGLNRSPY